MNHWLAAEIYHEASDGFGSGYLVTKGLILTALHTFHGQNQPDPPSNRECEIRLLDDFQARRPWRQGRLVWPGNDEWADCRTLDLALVEIDADSCTAALALRAPTIWTTLEAEEDVDCSACGYPVGQKFERDERELWLMRGRTNFISGSKQGLLFVGLTGEESLDPGSRFGTAGDWPGFSGSALFAGDRLVGVITRVDREGRTLKAARVDRALGWDCFRKRVDAGHVSQAAGEWATANSNLTPLPNGLEGGPTRPRLVTDIRRPNWAEPEIQSIAALLLECRSFYDAEVRGAMVDALPRGVRLGVVRSRATEQDAAAIVRAAVTQSNGLSSVLRVVRVHEEGSRAWKALIWLLLELSAPILTPSLLRRLATLGEDLDLTESDRLRIFDLVAGELSAVRFEQPRSWQDSIVLLADFIAEGKRPPVISLALQMRGAADPCKRGPFDEWIRDAAQELGINISPEDQDPRHPIALPAVEDLRLIFEITAGVVQPGKGFYVWAFLLTNESFENRGSAECGDVSELKRWIASHLDDVGRQVRGVKPILEFILPEEMFGEEFDRWPQYHDDIKSTPLGLIYPVVLRSRWRLRDPRAARHWADWEHWWDVLTTIGCSQMHWIGTPRDIRPDALYASLANGTPCGVGFGFAPRAKTALDLFGRALRAGAPILVWSRKTGASEAVARSELNSLVAGDVRTLPHRLLKRRRDAASKQGDDFGHNIAVIWDDSDRNPERMSNPLTARSLISS